MSIGLNNFRLGLFVLAALIILVVVLIMLGPGGFWQDKARLETYLDESAQGLDVGSAVKMRGVHIGSIDNIGFVAQKYPECAMDKRYVLVEINVLLKNFPAQTREEFAAYMQKEVQNGLRIKIMPQGLTGTAYLELDYSPPQRHPGPEINWEPENIYIPSAPGTIARLEETFESMGSTLASLEKVDWSGTFQSLNLLLLSLQDKVQAFPSLELGQQIQALLQETRQTNRQLRFILGRDVQDEFAGGNLQEVLAQITSTASGLENILANLDSALSGPQGGLGQLNSILHKLDQAAGSLPEILEGFALGVNQAQSSFSELNFLLSTHGDALGPVLRDLSATMRNLRELSQELKRSPGSLFLTPRTKGGELLYD